MYRQQMWVPKSAIVFWGEKRNNSSVIKSKKFLLLVSKFGRIGLGKKFLPDQDFLLAPELIPSKKILDFLWRIWFNIDSKFSNGGEKTYSNYRFFGVFARF